MRTSKTSFEKAQARVTEIKEFYNHLAMYLLFVCIFISINLYNGGYFWAIFPIGGWGLGVLSHAMKTFRWNLFFSKDWERRKIDEMMKNDDF